MCSTVAAVSCLEGGNVMRQVNRNAEEIRKWQTVLPPVPPKVVWFACQHRVVLPTGTSLPPIGQSQSELAI